MKALPIPVNQGLSVLMGLFFLSTILPAQIKIKERIYIEPNQVAIIQAAQQSTRPLYSIRTDYLGPLFPSLWAYINNPQYFTATYNFTVTNICDGCDPLPLTSLVGYPCYGASAHYATVRGVGTNTYSGSFQYLSWGGTEYIGFGFLVENFDIVLPTLLTLNQTSDSALFTYNSSNGESTLTGTISFSLTPNQIDNVLVQTQRDTINFGEQTDISIAAVDWYGNSIPLADSQRCSLSQYDEMTTPVGRIDPSGECTYQYTKDHKITYYADQTAPGENALIYLRGEVYVSLGYDPYWGFELGNWVVGEKNIVVRPVCILASFPKISVGDTATISFLYGDTQQPLLADKLLDVSILGGDGTNGWLLSSTGGPNTSLTRVVQPIRYIAPDSIQGDSLNVRIIATVSDNSSAVGGGVLSGKIGEAEKEKVVNVTGQSNNIAAKSIIGPKGSVIQTHPPTQALLNALTQNQCATGGGTVANPQLDHFEIRVISDTIAYTDTLRIVVRAMDKNGSPTRCEFDQLLKFSMEGESEYATFITPQGDTIRSTPAVLRDIPYLDAFQGDVRLAAVTRNPAIRNKPKIVIKLQEDETKKGEKEIIVLEQTLKIVMDSPYEVRPKIPTENGNPELVRKRKKTFGVKLTKGGILTGDHPFRLTTNYINGSGGHDHVDSLRLNSDDNYGLFESRQVDKRIARPMDDTTRSDYMTAYDYLSSIFGDTMKIYLRSQKNPLLKDSINVVEKVAGLQLLPDGTNYIKVGGTCEHHGPSDVLPSSSLCLTPDNNHWCSSALADSLRLAIEDFYDWSSSIKGGSTPITIYLNDMSLPLGGRFDIDGNWGGIEDQEHYYHRIGNSIDISKRDGITEDQIDQLTVYMRHFGLHRHKERPKIHYGLNEGY